jgi:hypothetical protein
MYDCPEMEIYTNPLLRIQHSVYSTDGIVHSFYILYTTQYTVLTE